MNSVEIPDSIFTFFFLKNHIIVGRSWKAFCSCDLPLMFKLIFKCFSEIKDKVCGLIYLGTSAQLNKDVHTAIVVLSQLCPCCRNRGIVASRVWVLGGDTPDRPWFRGVPGGETQNSGIQATHSDPADSHSADEGLNANAEINFSF